METKYDKKRRIIYFKSSNNSTYEYKHGKDKSLEIIINKTKIKKYNNNKGKLIYIKNNDVGYEWRAK